MRLEIISVGKKHDKNLENYLLEFEKRIKIEFDLIWTVISSVDDKSKEVQIKKEFEKIINILEKEKGDNFIILLDENGKQKTTIELSELFMEKMNQGVENIIFIIGGAYGVSEEVKSRANFI